MIFSIFSSGGHLIYRSGTVLAILLGATEATFLWFLNQIGPRVQEELAFKANYS